MKINIPMKMFVTTLIMYTTVAMQEQRATTSEPAVSMQPAAIQTASPQVNSGPLPLLPQPPAAVAASTQQPMGPPALPGQAQPIVSPGSVALQFASAAPLTQPNPASKVLDEISVTVPKNHPVCALLYAYQGNVEKLKQVNFDFSITLLQVAIMQGHKHTVEVLLEVNADVNIPDHKGNTPLHYAIAYNRPEIAQLLIAKKADVNKQDENGRTPLMLAAQKGLMLLVVALMKSGADKKLQDKNHKTFKDYVPEAWQEFATAFCQ